MKILLFIVCLLFLFGCDNSVMYSGKVIRIEHAPIGHSDMHSTYITLTSGECFNTPRLVNFNIGDMIVCKNNGVGNPICEKIEGEIKK